MVCIFQKELSCKHTNKFVRRMGIKARKMIHNKKVACGYGISSVMSPEYSDVPPGNWRKRSSYSYSPVVIVMVLTKARAGEAKGDLCKQGEKY